MPVVCRRGFDRVPADSVGVLDGYRRGADVGPTSCRRDAAGKVPEGCLGDTSEVLLVCWRSAGEVLEGFRRGAGGMPSDFRLGADWVLAVCRRGASGGPAG